MSNSRILFYNVNLNKIDIEIEIKDEVFIINGISHYLCEIELKFLQDIIHKMKTQYKHNIIVSNLYDEVRSKTEYLVFASIFDEYFYAYNEDMHTKINLTFDYAFPICHCPKSFRRQILQNLDEVIKNKLLVLSKADIIFYDLTKCKDKIDKLFRKHFKKYGKNEIEICKNKDVNSIFNFWKLFCKKRFQVEITNEKIKVLKNIYRINCCYCLNVFIKNQYCVSTLILQDDENQIIYGILAPWLLEFKKYRPGILSIFCEMWTAIELGYKYALGYGEQEYKLNLLKELAESDMGLK